MGCALISALTAISIVTLGPGASNILTGSIVQCVPFGKQISYGVTPVTKIVVSTIATLFVAGMSPAFAASSDCATGYKDFVGKMSTYVNKDAW